MIHSITGGRIVCRFPVFFLRTGKESAILYAMSRKKAVVRKPKIKKKTDYYDYSLLAVIILLTCFGLVMLYSTSSYMAELNYGDDMYYFKKQAAIYRGYLWCSSSADAAGQDTSWTKRKWSASMAESGTIVISAVGAREDCSDRLSFLYDRKYGKKDWYTERLYDAGRKWRCACIHNICIYR